MRPSRRMTQQRLKLILTNAQKVPQMSLRIEAPNGIFLMFLRVWDGLGPKVPQGGPKDPQIVKKMGVLRRCFWNSSIILQTCDESSGQSADLESIVGAISHDYESSSSPLCIDYL